MRQLIYRTPEGVTQEFNLDDFTVHYLIAALWTEEERLSEDSEKDTGKERSFDLLDFAPSAIERAIKDCTEFQQAWPELLAAAYELYPPHPDAPTPQCSAGHDFWLTRNGHGVGFWDRGFGRKLGDELTDACKACKEVTIELGDDGELHFF